MKIKFVFILSTFILLFFSTIYTKADDNEVQLRLDYYKKYSTQTKLPWYLIAAVDQYERNTKHYRDYCPKEDEVISICFEPTRWSGFSNPIRDDKQPYRILIFHGLGLDGNEDGLADRLNPDDRMTSLMYFLTQYGNDEESIKRAIMDYYNSEKGAQIIFQISQLFQKYETVDLSRRVFPIPRQYRADYSNNFGTGRSWGGNRSHEGVDIFAHNGTPVVSTSYGVVEIMGWNNFGGYRIGIRDVYNTYQYYAHLNYFVKGLKVGDIVEPGQVIGYVGSTGYGREGTRGKFPPHLHYGFYKFDGRKEWSFNPYNYLRRWERIRLR